MKTYDRNVDLPTSASPRRRMGTSGASRVVVVEVFAMLVKRPEIGFDIPFT